MTEECITWTIYEHPKDYPDKFVARKFILDRPTKEILIAESLEEIRKLVSVGKICFNRHETDDPVIVETWM